MDAAGPYPITSTGNQYCLMVGCYFSKWLECFPIPDQKATMVARKLVYEIVATPQASTGVSPNMMMLGRQTRLPVQAMYGTPLGLDEEERTMSEYITLLQEGLRAAYRHALEGLQRAALHQRHDYAGKVQRREYQAG